jgi:hypothetical protein
LPPRHCLSKVAKPYRRRGIATGERNEHTCALIATGIGGAFFSLGMAFPYRPSISEPDFSLVSILASNHSKARAAVSRLLINPSSAEFSGLRSVEANAEKYVCGNVNGKDKSGSYAGHRSFVYTVSVDFARIDDDGRIATIHAAYRPCPVSEDAKPSQKPEIAPQALTLAKNVLSILPKGTGELQQDLAVMQQALPTGESNATSTAMPQFGRNTEQEAASTTQSRTGSSSVTPPNTWPIFPPDDPLSKAASKRMNGETIALASDVEERWTNFRAKRSKAKPSTTEIKEALRALLAIDPRSQEFPKAWALFVRLREVDREATTMATR